MSEFATKLQGPRIKSCLYLRHVTFFYNLHRITNPLIAQKYYTAHTTVFNTWVVIRIRKNLLLCARMRTYDHTSPMQRINCLVPTSPVQPLAPPPQMSFSPLKPHMWHTLMTGDKITMLDSSSVRHRAWQRNKIQTAGIKARIGKQQ